MIREVVSVHKLADDLDAEDREYWLSLPMEERISAVEELRKRMWGDYESEQRLPRSAYPIQIIRR